MYIENEKNRYSLLMAIQTSSNYSDAIAFIFQRGKNIIQYFNSHGIHCNITVAMAIF